jgi:hypothetical protein
MLDRIGKSGVADRGDGSRSFSFRRLRRAVGERMPFSRIGHRRNKLQKAFRKQTVEVFREAFGL